MKIRQSSAVKGISIFEREIKISQFADDTNLLCLDLSSVEKGLQIAVDFGERNLKPCGWGSGQAIKANRYA